MGSPVDKEGEALIEGMGVAHQARRHGPNSTDHGVSFSLWAPSAKSVELLCEFTIRLLWMELGFLRLVTFNECSDRFKRKLVSRRIP
jgi:hypothetical protein